MSHTGSGWASFCQSAVLTKRDEEDPAMSLPLIPLPSDKLFQSKSKVSRDPWTGVPLLQSRKAAHPKTTHQNRNNLHKQFAQTLSAWFLADLERNNFRIQGGQFVQTVLKMSARTFLFFFGGWLLCVGFPFVTSHEEHLILALRSSVRLKLRILTLCWEGMCRRWRYQRFVPTTPRLFWGYF